LRGIEHSQPPRCPRADVNQTPPFAQAFGNDLDSPGNRRALRGDGSDNLAVLAVHELHEFQRRQLVEVHRGRVTRLGWQMVHDSKVLAEIAKNAERESL